MGWSRRQLLVGAAGLAAAPALPSRVRSEPLYPTFVPLSTEELFQKRLRFHQGEPRVSIGIARRLAELDVRSDRPLRLSFDEAGLPKNLYLQNGARLVAESSSPGRVEHWVIVDRGPIRDDADFDARRARWEQRARRTRVFERGVVVALAGTVLDTRERRIAVGGFDSREEADALALRLFERDQLAPSVEVELAELPRGRIQVFDGAGKRRAVASGAVCVSGARGHALTSEQHGTFAGHLYAVCDRFGGMSLVNSIGTERMLAGLVPAEIFANAPEEALKAQAVTARGAVFAKLGHRHFDEPFFLCSEQHCQVYRGVGQEQDKTSTAVASTRGLLAVRGGNGTPLKLVRSVYSSTCGGFSENNDVVWDQPPSKSLRGRLDGSTADPALSAFARGLDEDNIRAWLESYPPTFESRSSFVRPDKYRWKVSYSKEEIDGLVSSLGVGSVKRLEILGRGPGGRVTGLRIHGDAKSTEVLRELPVRRRFGNLNSGMFVIDHVRGADGSLERVEFTGGGWGHGVGMCQIGAIGRAEAQQDFRQILAHYYSGARVERLY